VVLAGQTTSAMVYRLWNTSGFLAFRDMTFHCRCFLHCACLFVVVVPPVHAGVGFSRKTLVAYGQIPVYFEKNLGQADTTALYTSHGAGCSVALTRKGARLSVSHKQVTLDFIGASARAVVTPEEPLAGHSNYYFGNDPRRWVENVPQFSRVRYRGLYPGVDLVWYGNGQQLEYDLVLQPGVDPSRIRLRFSGAGSVSIASNGDIVVNVGGDALRQRKPAVWQQRRASASASTPTMCNSPRAR